MRYAYAMEAPFLEVRCPNMPRRNSAQACRGMCGGITSEILEHFDFKVPFEDIRYCGSCGGFFKVVIRKPNAIPEYQVLPKGVSLPLFASIGNVTIFQVTGTRKKHGSSN